MDTLMPEYNVNKIAGSNKGRIYSSTVRTKMSKSKKGLISHRKGKTHRPSSILLMELNSGKSKKKKSTSIILMVLFLVNLLIYKKQL